MSRSLLGEPPACLTLTLTLTPVPLLQDCKAAPCYSPQEGGEVGTAATQLLHLQAVSVGQREQTDSPKATASRGRHL